MQVGGFKEQNYDEHLHDVYQGDILSPFLSNIYLNEMDIFLEKKEINFVRYIVNKQAKLLLGTYGDRVNYSVFEIELSEAKREKLLHEIELKKLINKKYDSLRFYHLCENCVPKSFDVGNREDPFEEQVLYV